MTLLRKSPASAGDKSETESSAEALPGLRSYFGEGGAKADAGAPAGSASKPRLEVSQITKNFGRVQALSNIEFQCQSSSSILLLGPNGAGKTTLLRILALLMRPSSGNVLYDGTTPTVDTKKKIGFSGHTPHLYQDLTVLENLTFFSKLQGYDTEHSLTKVKEVLEEFDLDELSHHVIRTLSQGVQQRVNLARSFLHSPSILLMDEPFVHLDQKTAMFLLEKLQKFTSLGGSLILTTHQLELSKSLKAQWVILKNGKIVYQGNANSTSDDITQIYTKLTS